MFIITEIFCICICGTSYACIVSRFIFMSIKGMEGRRDGVFESTHLGWVFCLANNVSGGCILILQSNPTKFVSSFRWTLTLDLRR
jgi:hypothetical protein